MDTIISIITSVYNGETYLENFFGSVLHQSIIKKCELIIILNEGSGNEKDIIEKNKNKLLNQLTLIQVSPKEHLSHSWNKGILLAKGKYISFWNVDDQRSPDSLEKQVFTLENNPDIVMTYGDFIEVRNVNDNVGLRFISPEFKKEVFKKRFASGGAFLVFRSDIFPQCGYFDEQLEIAADYDFVLRLINMNYKFKKTLGDMGYFLNNKLGLSTQVNDQKLEIEQNIIFRRYRIFDKMKWEYRNISEINNYSKFLFFSEYLPISQFGFTDFEKEFDSPNQKISFWGKNLIRTPLKKNWIMGKVLEITRFYFWL